MTTPIHLRFSVQPVDQQDQVDAVWVDIQFTEDDLQTIDDRHGLQDFIEKFVEPGLVYLLDQFQQYYEGADDLMAKTIDIGRATLPRSIDFYRQKVEMMKAAKQRSAN